MIPGDDACIMSGLKFATCEIIRGLRARDRGTFVYQGQGKLNGEQGTISSSIQGTHREEDAGISKNRCQMFDFRYPDEG